MKLNKVLALALSGVMAVSMLAGCKGGSANGEQDDVVVTPTTSNAVTIMNNMQSKIEFKADTNMDAAVAAAAESLESSVLKTAPTAVTGISKKNDVFNAVDDKMDGAYNLGVDTTFAKFHSRPTKKGDVTETALYWVKAANLSEENVLTLVANAMQINSYVDGGITGSGAPYYEVDYTGAVSIVKATATSEGGDTYNAYIVAVSVTQSGGAETNLT